MLEWFLTREASFNALFSSFNILAFSFFGNKANFREFFFFPNTFFVKTYRSEWGVDLIALCTGWIMQFTTLSKSLLEMFASVLLAILRNAFSACDVGLLAMCGVLLFTFVVPLQRKLLTICNPALVATNQFGCLSLFSRQLLVVGFRKVFDNCFLFFTLIAIFVWYCLKPILSDTLSLFGQYCLLEAFWGISLIKFSGGNFIVLLAS